MRDMFPGWYVPDGNSKDQMWNSAWVVLDSSTLLNLYKYPESARNDLFLGFAKVKDRLWLPHQVALEFQRNRLSVIADQVKKFDDASKVVTDFKNKLNGELGKLQLAKRHSAINPEKLLNNIEAQIETFLKELTEMKEKQPRVNSPDLVRSKLDELLFGRIGAGPANQAELDEMYAEAEERYKNDIPPGFKDEDSKGDSAHFSHGLRYVRKFGDFVLWKQILKHVAGEEQKNVIFVTDDEKPDWWHIVDSQGKHRLGPNVLLGEEFAKETKGASVLFHTSDQFLFEARTRFKLKVSSESISQLRDIAEADAESGSPFSPSAVEWTFFYWLRDRHDGAWIHRRQFFPDFIVEEAARKTGYDVKFLRNPQPFHIFPILESSQKQAAQYVAAATFNNFVLAIVVMSEDAAEHVRRGWVLSVERVNIEFATEVYVISQGPSDPHPRLRLHDTLVREIP